MALWKDPHGRQSLIHKRISCVTSFPRQRNLEHLFFFKSCCCQIHNKHTLLKTTLLLSDTSKHDVKTYYYKSYNGPLCTYVIIIQKGFENRPIKEVDIAVFNQLPNCVFINYTNYGIMDSKVFFHSQIMENTCNYFFFKSYRHTKLSLCRNQFPSFPQVTQLGIYHACA